MQKILIGTNFELDTSDEDFLNILKEVYSRDDTYWYKYQIDNWYLTELRTDEKLHKAIIDRNFIIGFAYGEDKICKIIELEDDIKWDIRNYECDIGEYICEKHRTWE